eukprot:gene10064-13473_t
MDLSLWPTKKSSAEGNVAASKQDVSYGATIAAGRYYILDDHTAEAINHMKHVRASGKPVNVDIIVDNAGYELVSDLLLGHVLLATGAADKVTFHTKGHPTFVSDATTDDVHSTIDFLKEPFQDIVREATATVAHALQTHVDNGKIQIVDDLFWCQPTAFWDMPAHIRDKLSS